MSELSVPNPVFEALNMRRIVVFTTFLHVESQNEEMSWWIKVNGLAFKINSGEKLLKKSVYILLVISI